VGDAATDPLEDNPEVLELGYPVVVDQRSDEQVMAQQDLSITEKTRIVRVPGRASYDRKLAYEIIDATPICHVSYVIGTEPYITPTLQWREGNDVYWHGSSASRFLRNAGGARVALNVILFDGVVLARSAFHHSANYRSVTILGKPERWKIKRSRRGCRDSSTA
jgi:hypothetical protein